MNPHARRDHSAAKGPARRPSAGWPPVLELEEMVGMGYFPEELETPPPHPLAEPGP
jgi:hypothetical protein